MSGDRVFVDTNIMVYAYDTSAGLKRKIARRILDDLWSSGLGVVSTQVLQEFFVTVTRKLSKPIDPSDARGVVKDFLNWDVAVVDGAMVVDAIDLQMTSGYSFWDSLIVTAAARAGCGVLLTEDLSSGQCIAGVTLSNPFE